MSSRDYVKLYSDLGVRISQDVGDEASCFCPIHKDVEKPSFSFNRVTGLYKCFVATCPAFSGGNYEKLFKLVKGEDFEDVVPLEEIEKHHQLLLKNPRALKWLHEVRGINEASIIKYKLGYDGERVWIPINANGKWVNVRKHSSNKTSRVKTVSYRAGFGSVKLWPDTSIKPDCNLMVCEGELDCIVANQLGYSAVTVTGGAGSWKDEFTAAIRKAVPKSVILLYDIDLAGRSGASLVCKKLVDFVSCIKDVLLPITAPANADLTDYVVTYNGTKEALDLIIEATKPYDKGKDETKPVKQEAVDEDIGKLAKPEYLGKRIRVRATVNGIDSTPYVAPKQLEFTCKVAGNYKYCNLCPLMHNGGKMVVDIPEYSQDILRSIDVTEEQQRVFLRKITGIYPSCPRWDFKINSCYVLYDVRLIPEISYSARLDQEFSMMQAFAIGHNIRANHTYKFEGTPFANPKNQYMTLLMDKSEPVKDDLADFKLTLAQIKSLTIFQCENDKIKDKMYEIAHDLCNNVTNIYEREDLVIACDLVYHSALNFAFQGRMLQKGRCDLLVIGDTRCGKSETFLGLINHYKAGELITGENTTKAGLLGGAQQIGSRWLTTWGKLPMNDRRLLIVDEISGMPVEDIGQLSGVRSSGIAEITKIQSEKIYARTRTIWSGNPRSAHPLASYDTGVQAIHQLIGRPEDIARFDFAVALMSGEVSLDKINAGNRSPVEHKYTTDLCHILVIWAWSRRPDHIKFTPEAEALCLRLATEMSQRYSSFVPLVEGAEQRVKLARLATACAIRLFSTNDGEHVTVEAEHVQYVHDFLERQYAGRGLNYLAYSKVKIAEQNLRDEATVRGVVTTYGPSFVEGLLDHQYIRLNDLEDMLNLDKKEVKPIISQLLKEKALKHYGSLYIKTPAFIMLLRKMQTETIKVKEPEF